MFLLICFNSGSLFRDFTGYSFFFFFLIFFVLIIVSFCVYPWALNFELGLKLLNRQVKLQVLNA